MFFDFYGFVVRVVSDSNKTIDLIKKDFSHFISENKSPSFFVQARVTSKISNKVPSGLSSVRQNARAITYEKGELRFNDFYGKAVSVLDYSKNTMEIFSANEDYLHELLYLAVLSRETKFHDLKGLHKVHAFGVSKGETALIGMMNMKGGKTTLFSYFLDQDGYDLISDDTPLIDKWGRVRAFPVRIGFEPESHSGKILQSYSEKAYSFHREEYGEKQLVDLAEFKNNVSSMKKRSVLFQGVRVHGLGRPEIEKVGRLKMLRCLLKNMVIGIGLPMVLEYYLEGGLKGKIKDIRIILGRLRSALFLLSRSECYFVKLGKFPLRILRPSETYWTKQMLNKEVILNALWKTTKIPLLSSLWRLLYWACYQLSKFYFVNFSGAKHVYVKGSYVSGTYEPLVSDIDFVLDLPGRWGIKQAKGRTLEKNLSFGQRRRLLFRGKFLSKKTLWLLEVCGLGKLEKAR